MNYKTQIKTKVKELLEDPNKKTVKIEIPEEKYINIKPIRSTFNKIIIQVSRKIVPSHIKNWLMRRAGLNIGHDVCLPNDIIFDPYFPELITVEDGALIGAPNKVMAHEYKDGILTLGKILVKKRVLVGAFSYLKPGAVINEKSILNFGSELNQEVPEGELWGDRPAKFWKKFTEEELEKYFKPSTGNYKEYYKEARKKIKEFQKNPEIDFLKMHYDGKRLNAGDDWWRARNVLRIFYNGVIIELTRLLPHCFIKTLLLKMVGVKIGKNVTIGKGTVFDHIYCDMMAVEDDVKIGKCCEFGGHEYTITQTVFGRTLIKKGAELKDHVLVRAGTTVGEKSVIEPYSGIQKEIPANERWKGMPAKFVEKLEK
ncbi:hypothetical protein KY343_05465 [Candidatus Woesearchaeota archaeon]|nr:hypothetical protein [Candidatus Woesearchaeota archaeon]